MIITYSANNEFLIKTIRKTKYSPLPLYLIKFPLKIGHKGKSNIHAHIKRKMFQIFQEEKFKYPRSLHTTNVSSISNRFRECNFWFYPTEMKTGKCHFIQRL